MTTYIEQHDDWNYGIVMEKGVSSDYGLHLIVDADYYDAYIQKEVDSGTLIYDEKVKNKKIHKTYEIDFKIVKETLELIRKKKICPNGVGYGYRAWYNDYYVYDKSMTSYKYGKYRIPSYWMGWSANMNLKHNDAKILDAIGNPMNDENIVGMHFIVLHNGTKSRLINKDDFRDGKKHSEWVNMVDNDPYNEKHLLYTMFLSKRLIDTYLNSYDELNNKSEEPMPMPADIFSTEIKNEISEMKRDIHELIETVNGLVKLIKND